MFNVKTFIPLTFLCLSLTCWGAPASPELPEVGSSASQSLSLAEEDVIGHVLMDSIRRENLIMEDAEVNAYLQTLGDRLVKVSVEANRPYHFFLVKEQHVNAFAWPGAWIAVHSGLILQTRRESELAAVLAHEIAHVSQRHHARMFEKAKQMSIPSLAALIAAMAVTVAAPGIGNAALASVMAGTQQAAINFTRHNEQEADRVGIDTLAKAQFDVNSMAGFFGRMQELSRYSENTAIPELLRSHPMSTSRMADAQNRSGRYQGNPVKESTLYEFMKERVRVLTHSRVELETFYRKTSLKTPALRYGKAFAEYREGKLAAAQATLAPLLNDPSLPATVDFLSAQILIASGNSEEGFRKAKYIYEQNPENFAFLLDLARLYLNKRQPEQAKTLLRRAVIQESERPEPYALLITTYTQLGDLKMAYLSQADLSMTYGSYERALFELKRAQTTPPASQYYDALIEASIKKAEYQLKKQQRVEKDLGIKRQ